MNVNTNNTSSVLYYTHTDHLGSIINVHNEGLSFDYNQSFDAWGNYRDPGTWQYTASSSVTPQDWLIRGYTGHEHLRNFGVINMNGRAYDPLFAQVLSPDPVTQFPSFSQGFERYSYCMNNPLKYTDPSGYDEEEDKKDPEPSSAAPSAGSGFLNTVANAIGSAASAFGNAIGSAASYEFSSGFEKLGPMDDINSLPGGETTQTSSNAGGSPPSDFYDKKGNVKHIDDGSNAVFQQTGTGNELHYEFMGFDPNGGGANLITMNVFQSALQQQQQLNYSNPSLQESPILINGQLQYDANGNLETNTWCNFATQNILNMTYSILGSNLPNQYAVSANNMVSNIFNANPSIFQVTDLNGAMANAQNGGLSLLGYSHAGHGHVASFTVGDNIKTGIIANIGLSKYSGFVSLNTAIASKRARTYYILNIPEILK